MTDKPMSTDIAPHPESNSIGNSTGTGTGTGTGTDNNADNSIERAAHTILSIASSMPTLAEVAAIVDMSQQANQRGYFDPEQDDALRELFSRYLTARAALIETIEDLRPLARAELGKSGPDVFILSYAASILLMRAAYLLIESFRDNRFAAKKLDEAEPRFGIARKQFTKIYRSSTSLRNIWAFMEARRYWDHNRADFSQRFASTASMQQVLELLNRDEPWIETSAGFYATNKLKYRLHSLLRRQYSGAKKVTFVLFKVSGRLVSELQLQWIHKRKRVTAVVQRKLSKLLEPGDIIVTRHDDAATNLFLPGFWPHAALYIGNQQQRDKLGLEPIEQDLSSSQALSVLEALKDGVRFRPLSSTLSVDACVIIRPKLDAEHIREALARAISHEGKGYDFEFDFRRSDKLVCTELPYRAYHGCGQIEFELSERAGRLCLSAEDLLDHALDGRGFDLIAIYGYRGNRFATGQRARQLLEQSYRK